MSVSRIDVHFHYLPLFYREALVAAGLGQPDGIAALPDWSEAGMLATMDRLGIARAYLSVSSPGVHFGDDAAARTLARALNEEAARLKAAYPDRIEFFAVTPLPDVQGALDEIAFSLDHLGAAGIVFETNFHGCYLGDTKLDAVYALLEERQAVLFLHPTTPGHPCGCGDLRQITLGYPAPMIEFLFDTTRSVTNMVLSGVLERCPNIRVIVPHAGAALPILAARIDLVGPMLAPKGSASPPAMGAALRKLHFDLAGAPVPELLTALLAVADPDRLHYGSDWPFTPAEVCATLAAAIDGTPILDADLRSKVLRGNAEKLFARHQEAGVDDGRRT